MANKITALTAPNIKCLLALHSLYLGILIGYTECRKEKVNE